MLYEETENRLETGTKIKAHLGKASDDGVEWRLEGVFELYVQKDSKGKVTLIALKDVDWAEYYVVADYQGNNLFINEDYYLEIKEFFVK
jgi:hypothetical protein